MKKKKIRKKKLAYGTNNGIVRNYIDSPSKTLVENDIAMAKAQESAMSNGWVKGLDIFGGMAMQYGTSMMNSPGASTTVPGGKKAFGQVHGSKPSGDQCARRDSHRQSEAGRSGR